MARDNEAKGAALHDVLLIAGIVFTSLLAPSSSGGSASRRRA